MKALDVSARLLGKVLGPILRPVLTPALRWLDTAIVPALDIDWSDSLTDDDWPREWEPPHLSKTDAEVAELAAELADDERLTTWLRGPAS